MPFPSCKPSTTLPHSTGPRVPLRYHLQVLPRDLATCRSSINHPSDQGCFLLPCEPLVPLGSHFSALPSRPSASGHKSSPDCTLPPKISCLQQPVSQSLLKGGKPDMEIHQKAAEERTIKVCGSHKIRKGRNCRYKSLQKSKQKRLEKEASTTYYR